MYLFLWKTDEPIREREREKGRGRDWNLSLVRKPNAHSITAGPDRKLHHDLPRRWQRLKDLSYQVLLSQVCQRHAGDEQNIQVPANPLQCNAISSTHWNFSMCLVSKDVDSSWLHIFHVWNSYGNQQDVQVTHSKMANSYTKHTWNG